jgi:uncharacterized protein (TIGR03083 family)
MSQQEFVGAVRREQEAVLAAIAGLSEDSLTTVPICGTWTAKDVLGHLAASDATVLGAVQLAHRGEPVRWAWDGYADFDRWNAEEAARRQDWPLARVLAELQETQAALLAELASWPAGAGPFGADSWDEARSPFGWLPSHEAEHGAMIRSLRSAATP